MPHVVFSGSVDLYLIFKKCDKIFFKRSKEGGEGRTAKTTSSTMTTTLVFPDNLIVRIDDFFIDPSGHQIMAKAVVVEGKISSSFYILINAKSDKTATIRLDPLTDPEKTPGVKTALALTAKKVLENFPDLKVTQTNIHEFLDDVFGS
jgi:hypothetical protein